MERVGKAVERRTTAYGRPGYEPVRKERLAKRASTSTLTVGFLGVPRKEPNSSLFVEVFEGGLLHARTKFPYSHGVGGITDIQFVSKASLGHTE